MEKVTMKPIAVMLLFAMAVMAAASQTATQKPAFEVASVKEEPPGPNIGTGIVRPLSGGRLSAEKAFLRVLIWSAYRVRDYQVVGGPDWMNSTRYNIEAKAADNANPSELMLMLQSLLEDRFDLKVHRTTRQLPIYELHVNGIITKLQRRSPEDCRAGNQPGVPQPPVPNQSAATRSCGGTAFISATTARIDGGAMPVSELAFVLGNIVGRPMVDKTALTGTFDIHLEFARDQALQGTPAIDVAPPTPDPTGVTVFTAVREQLGLKLESAKGPVEVLVIDSVSKPSEN
jgi:uncharacterized protein (TIGR03435 family)